MLIPVILSGGSGSRLWPQSRMAYPKQFIALHSHKTLLQEVIERLDGLPDITHIIIVTNINHRFLIAEQLQKIAKRYEIHVMLEPYGRNTAPAIIIAALQAKKIGYAHANLLVLTADHFIADQKAFHKAIKIAQLATSNDYIATFGVEPNHPNTGYGYIKTGTQNHDGYAIVTKFTEKPDRNVAERYLAEGGYYWNSGMILLRVDACLKHMEYLQPETLHACKHALHNAQHHHMMTWLDEPSFAQCENKSIDYALLEKTDKAVMVPLHTHWLDIGAWDALWEVLPKNTNDNVIDGDVITLDTHRSYIRSETKLIATLGVENLVIIESDDAILIANKSRTQEVKDIVEQLRYQNRIEAQVHRKRHFSWGHINLIDQGHHFKVNRIMIYPESKLPSYRHYNCTEHWTVVQGTANIYKNKELRTLTENQSISISPGVLHQLENPEKVPLDIIEIQSGTYLKKDACKQEDDYDDEHDT